MNIKPHWNRRLQAPNIYLFNIYQERIKLFEFVYLIDPSLNEPSSPGIKKQESLNQNNGDDDDDDDKIMILFSDADDDDNAFNNILVTAVFYEVRCYTTQALVTIIVSYHR